METRTYYGSRNHRIAKTPVVGYDIATDGRVWSGGPLMPEPPATFGWGHDIGGSNHLAYALLRHATGSAAIAQEHHLQFAKDVVVHWGSEWTCTLDDILQWLNDSIPSIKNVIKDKATFIAGFRETRTVLHCAMRHYRGERSKDGIAVNVQHVPGDSDPVQYALSPECARRLLCSPDNLAFGWGYSGGSTRLLALAILLDATNRIDLSKANHERFAAQIVQSWPDRWEISSMEICSWLAASGAFLAKGGA
jgi:hypothetical protein